MRHLVSNGRRGAAVLAMALVVALAACSDDDEENGGTVGPDGSPNLPTHDQLQAALDFAQAQDNKGFGLNMWATVVDREWHRPGHRVHGRQDGRSMAGIARYLGAEGEHRQQPSLTGLGVVHRQSL